MKETGGNIAISGDVHGNVIIGEHNAINKNNPSIEDVLKILPAFIKELKKNAQPEDLRNIKIIEEAQEASKKGDKQKARKLLSQAGGWILNTGSKIASEFGVAVITNYFKSN